MVGVSHNHTGWVCPTRMVYTLERDFNTWNGGRDIHNGGRDINNGGRDTHNGGRGHT